MFCLLEVLLKPQNERVLRTLPKLVDFKDASSFKLGNFKHVSRLQEP